MTLLSLAHVTCQYAQHVVFENLSFDIAAGELICLLGPSGCGKTTALRAIAGFEPITQGIIRLQDRILSKPQQMLAPEQRQIGMVFQDYALFPHLTVLDNVRFGLRTLPRAERLARARHFLAVVGLSDYAQRYPHELSGGQQQRVALARALAPQPAMLLLDEPFSNLDVDLRERLSVEVRDILKNQGITALLVTHDQHEAFALSDKIGVMSAGQIVQWDTAFTIYHHPANRFVANFIGQSALIRGQRLPNGRVMTELGEITVAAVENTCNGQWLDVLIRPDDVVIDPHGSLHASIEQRAFKGADTLYTLRLPSGDRVYCLLPSQPHYALNEVLTLRLVDREWVAFAVD
ncbi:ABC transporter ATP-binding protein [Thioflexithrix psekupsensis]|uniref:ABC transporter ATP-binding protein n=1 Tax=Thioflexithrix psekupsensis TaxID=1570016 RepID=A0A251X562_9GAMM|nr:ABC transporter ATP-binding protein [Thioflexithrix psekupsensis]OUD12077.1 ABC transporter ATP-binding protein [Thioflexithrix psekupsensis]